MKRGEWNDDTIFDLIPDGILAVNRDLVMIRMNHSARLLLDIREDALCEGKAVVSVMEEDGFRRLLGGRQQFSDTIRLPGKNIWLERFFCCDREKTVLLCVMRDVTGQWLREEQLRKDLRRAAELADTLNENHLRTVREVSSLLGENAAQSQILLRELKEAILPAERQENG